MPSFRGEYAPLHPRFPQGSAAACVRLTSSPPSDMEDLVYTPEDNAAVEEFVRERSDTTWHSVSMEAFYLGLDDKIALLDWNRPDET